MSEGAESLERLRRVTAEALVDHFAQDHMSVEEFERRIARARACVSRPELRRLLDGLPGRGSSAAAEPAPPLDGPPERSGRDSEAGEGKLAAGSVAPGLVHLFVRSALAFVRRVRGALGGSGRGDGR